MVNARTHTKRNLFITFLPLNDISVNDNLKAWPILKGNDFLSFNSDSKKWNLDIMQAFCECFWIICLKQQPKTFFADNTINFTNSNRYNYKDRNARSLHLCHYIITIPRMQSKQWWRNCSDNQTSSIEHVLQSR